MLRDVCDRNGLNYEKVRKPLPGYDPSNPLLTTTGLGPGPLHPDERAFRDGSEVEAASEND
jgi:hypothetical protein